MHKLVLLLILLSISSVTYSASNSFKSSSFKSGSFKSSSTSKPKFTSSKPVPKKTKSTFNLISDNSKEKKKTFLNNISKNQAKKKFNEEYLTKFKKAKPKESIDISKIQSNHYVNKAKSYNRSSYYSRRSSYYNDYKPPVYIYETQSSFGMWDAMMFWFMLDHITDKSQYELAYNKQNDPGYIEWRKEADQLAINNYELRKKLDDLDRQVKTLNGTPINNDYIPKGMDVDLMLSSDVIETTKPTLNICTGNEKGYYYIYGHKLKEILSNSLDVSVKITTGSVDNLNKLEDNQCDAALVQRDTYSLYNICSNDLTEVTKEKCKQVGFSVKPNSKMLFTKLATPFSDTILALCTSKYLFTANTISLVKGGGDVITWYNLVNIFPHLENTNIIMTNNIYESVTNVNKGFSECSLLVMNTENDNLPVSVNNKVKLAPITNEEITKVKDSLGEPLYSTKKLITSFKALHRNNSLFFPDYTNTMNVNVDLIISNKWMNANKQQFDGIKDYVN